MHLVRWKFEANSLLNPGDKDTAWYHQIHPNKDEAVTHYISLLQSGMEGIVVEIYELTPLQKGMDCCPR